MNWSSLRVEMVVSIWWVDWGGLGNSFTYRLVGGGAAGQLGGLPPSPWWLEVAKAIISTNRTIEGILWEKMEI